MPVSGLKSAWAVVITSNNNYIKGVFTLAEALYQVNSQYPLLVLYTNAVPKEFLLPLEHLNCILKQIDLIQPSEKIDYSAERFIDTWTKLSVWNQHEYKRIVLLDSDMLPFKNMDELMTMNLNDEHWVAACHACRCNPNRIKAYPPHWIPSNCAYTHGHGGGPLEPSRCYFNSGLIVLTPSVSIFESMVHRLQKTPNLSFYVFPDQDFLNEIFEDHWVPLPYIYNALKTLPQAHPSLWKMSDIKNIHYIQGKPWDNTIESLVESEKIYLPLYETWWSTYQSTKTHLASFHEQ
ncbi:nucleotide-diphospho-sugar transferase [Spinellus fusiger]|nr:nucleotide-diphospho-sugar transferase [Spinellus fusiger]